MSRSFRFVIAAVVVTASSSMLAPGNAQAQGFMGGGQGFMSDPFSFYYAFYLPNQQLQAMRPSPMDSINSAMVSRQYYTKSNRQSLYNPISPYSDANADPNRPFSSQQGQERIAAPYRYAQDPSNADGGGPSLYYNRATQYFPTLRLGRGPNGNVSPRRSNVLTRRPGGGGGGGMMGGMGGGMGGMGGMGMM